MTSSLKEAVQRATASLDRESRQQTAAYYIAFTMLGLILAGMGPTLPGLAEHTGVRLSQISTLFVTRSLGTTFGAVLAGRLYDRRPGHPILVVDLILIALLLFLTPLISRLWLLVGILFLVGLTEGLIDVGINTLIVWVHGQRVGPFMNGLHFFFGIGAFLAPIIVAQALLYTDDIIVAYWALACFAVPLAVWFTRLPGPAPHLTQASRQTGVANPRLIILIALFLALYVAAEVSFGGWIYSYAVAMDLAGEAQAAYLNSAFWGAFTLGRLASIPVAAYVRPQLVLLVDLLGALASVALLLFFPSSQVVAWMGTIILGLSLAAVFPTALSFAERRMPITGRVTGWFFVGASLGAMTLPWLIGQLFETMGPRATMGAILVDLVLALAVFAFLSWRSPKLATIRS